jgi:hypothetical protein
MSLLPLHRLPPGQPTIQNYPEILDQHRKVHGNSNKERFRETRKFPFLVNSLISVLSEFTYKLISQHLYSVKSPL